MAENDESAALTELQAELAAKQGEGTKKRRKPNKHTEMKAKPAAAKYKEMKAKAAAVNVASKQNIASDFWTPSPTAKGSVHAQQYPKTISRGNLPTCPTRGIDCGPGQESTWAAEAGVFLPKDCFVLKTPLVFLL